MLKMYAVDCCDLFANGPVRQKVTGTNVTIQFWENCSMVCEWLISFFCYNTNVFLNMNLRKTFIVAKTIMWPQHALVTFIYL